MLQRILCFVCFHFLLIDGFSLRFLQAKPPPKTKPSPSPFTLPADDSDPTSRNNRLNQRGRNWNTRKYSTPDQYYNFTGQK